MSSNKIKKLNKYLLNNEKVNCIITNLFNEVQNEKKLKEERDKILAARRSNVNQDLELERQENKELESTSSVIICWLIIFY